MLLPSFFVVNMDQFDMLPDVPLPANGYLSFKLHSLSALQIDSFYKKLFLSPPKHDFCVLVDLDDLFLRSDIEQRNAIDLLISLSFHFNYIKTESDKPCVLLETDQLDTDDFISTMIGAFKNQGYDEVETILVNKKVGEITEQKKLRFNVTDNFDNVLSDYTLSIKQLDSFHTQFFFFLENAEKLPGFLNALEKEEMNIKESLPKVYNLLKESMSLKIKERELHANLVLIQEQLDSLNNYHLYHNLSETRYKKQIKELLRFYKNEYEILPTWYKRFGHIVKVMTGKRTFRSLFNDNVKKYKD